MSMKICRDGCECICRGQGQRNRELLVTSLLNIEGMKFLYARHSRQHIHIAGFISCSYKFFHSYCALFFEANFGNFALLET